MRWPVRRPMSNLSSASQIASAPVDTTGATTTPPSRPAADQSLYTGQPTLLTQVVEFGLRVVDVILKPFGGLLAFTSLDVPFFTDGVPPFFLTGGLTVQKSDFQGTTVWALQPQQPSGKYVIALHGGAYTAQVSLFHWETYADLARNTGATVIAPLYPLIDQGGTAGVVVPQTATSSPRRFKATARTTSASWGIPPVAGWRSPRFKNSFDADHRCRRTWCSSPRGWTPR